MSEKESKGQNGEVPVCQGKELGLSPAAVGSLRRSPPPPPAGNGIKQMGVWGSLPLASLWDTWEGKRNFGEEALSASKQSGPGPRRWQRERDGKRRLKDFKKEGD